MKIHIDATCSDKVLEPKRHRHFHRRSLRSIDEVRSILFVIFGQNDSDFIAMVRREERDNETYRSLLPRTIRRVSFRLSERSFRCYLFIEFVRPSDTRMSKRRVQARLCTTVSPAIKRLAGSPIREIRVDRLTMSRKIDTIRTTRQRQGFVDLKTTPRTLHRNGVVNDICVSVVPSATKLTDRLPIPTVCVSTTLRNVPYERLRTKLRNTRIR